MTQYSHRITIACPEYLFSDANHLALIIGESSADISTFSNAGYQDAAGNLYGVASAVCKQSVIEAQNAGLPETPPHAEELVDREAASRAWSKLGTELLLSVDEPPKDALERWGIYAIPDSTGSADGVLT